MLKPSDLIKELKAISQLNNIRLPALKTVLVTAFIVSAYFGYNKLKPIKSNIDDIPVIKQQLTELLKRNNTDSTLVKSISDIKKEVNRMSTKVDTISFLTLRNTKELGIIKQQFPDIRQRFIDLNEGMEIQNQLLKKNELGQLTPLKFQ